MENNNEIKNKCNCRIEGCECLEGECTCIKEEANLNEEPTVAVKRNININCNIENATDEDKCLCNKKALLIAGASIVAVGVTGGILYLAKKSK